MDEKMISTALRDAGCGRKEIEECQALFREGELDRLRLLLRKRRKALLEKVHQQQDGISIIDYIIFNLKESYKEKQDEIKI